MTSSKGQSKPPTKAAPKAPAKGSVPMQMMGKLMNQKVTAPKKKG